MAGIKGHHRRTMRHGKNWSFGRNSSFGKDYSRGARSESEFERSISRALAGMDPDARAEFDSVSSRVDRVVATRDREGRAVSVRKAPPQQVVVVVTARPQKGIARWNDERDEIVGSTQLLSSTQVGRIVFPNSKEPRSSVAYRRSRGEIIGLRQGNSYLYPDFQFDDGGVIPEVAQLNRVLDAGVDPWGALSWWQTESETYGMTHLELLRSGRLTAAAVDTLLRIDLHS